MDDKRNMRNPEVKTNTQRISGTQNLHIDNRQRVFLTGVTNVENFNELEIVLETDLGMLTIKGSSLHINKLNLETGELFIEGNIDMCSYSEKQDIKTKGAGLLSKLFK